MQKVQTMQDSVSEKICSFIQMRIPLFTTMLLVFVSFVPSSSLQINYFRPLVGLICIYYWALKREYMFGYISAGTVGILIDIYSSSPLGLNMLLLMLLVACVHWVLRNFQSSSFSVNWLIFALLSLGAVLSKWLLLMMYAGRIFPIWEAMYSYCSTVMFYPLVALFNGWVQDSFMPQERING